MSLLRGVQVTIAKLELERRQIKLEKREVDIELKILSLKQMPPASEIIDLTASPEVVDLTASPIHQPSIKSESLCGEQNVEVVEMGREEDLDPALGLGSVDEVDLQHLVGKQGSRKIAIKREREHLPDPAHSFAKERHQQLRTPASSLPSPLADDNRSDTLSAHSPKHILSPAQDQVPFSEPHKNFLQKRRKRSCSPVRDDTDLDHSSDGPKRQRRRISHIFYDFVERPAHESPNANKPTQGDAAGGAVPHRVARKEGPAMVANTIIWDAQHVTETASQFGTRKNSSVKNKRSGIKPKRVYEHHRTEICRSYGAKLRNHMLQSKYCPPEDRDDLVDILRQVFESETTWKTLDDVHEALRVGLASVDDWRTRGELLTQLNNFQMASQWWWAKCMNDEKLISPRGRLEIMKKAVNEVANGVFIEAGYSRAMSSSSLIPKERKYKVGHETQIPQASSTRQDTVNRHWRLAVVEAQAGTTNDQGVYASL